MLTCRSATLLTTAYLDDALPPRQRLAIRWHLSICSFCRRHLRQLRQTIDLLRRLPPEQPTQTTEDCLVAEIIAGRPPTRPFG